MGLDMYMYVSRKGDEKKLRIVYDEETKEEMLMHPDGSKEKMTIKSICARGRYGWAYYNEAGKRIKQDEISNHLCAEFMYWRKFNALHNWFVENYEGGNEDDCRTHEVSIEKIRSLVKLFEKIISKLPRNIYKIFKTDWEKADEICAKAVADNKELFAELFPTTTGFFFGSTKYDAYYFWEIYRTLRQFKRLVEMYDNGEVYKVEYCASW